MTTFQAFILGIVQGLTEFLPVSSTAHLLIAQGLLGIKATDASFAFTVLVQLGTLLALFVFYWKDMLEIFLATLRGVLERKPFEDPRARLGWNIALASIPALAVGFFMRDVVEGLFREPVLEAGIRLVLTTILLVIAEKLNGGSRGVDDMKGKDVLTVGVFQALAVFPGASRSGSSITGGMVRGMSRPTAARFAFLISAPLMLVAGAYQSWQVILLPGTRLFLPILSVGFIAAAIVGWLSLRWLVHYLNRHSLYVFSLYTGIIGILCVILHFAL